MNAHFPPPAEKSIWTPERDAIVLDLASHGSSPADIAAALGVSVSAVSTRMSRIGARPLLDALTKEAIAEKVAEGWRHSRIARQYGVHEALIPSIVAAVEKGTHILSNDRRGDRFGDPRKPGPKPKPRPSWTTTPPAKDTRMTKNRLSDLNDHLFAQLERLSDEDLTSEEIEKEATRAEAIVAVADKIIQNASLGIQAARLVAAHGSDPTPYLKVVDARPVVPAPVQVEHRP